jgi:uncharacterized protein
MSAAAVIDSLEFARAGEELRGSVPVTSLERLDDVLFDSRGRLDYELRGSRDGRNRPQLELKISGPLHLQCQRCLGLLDYAVDIAATLRLVPRGAQLDDEADDPEGPDLIEADAELEVADLIEEEVLLSLPLAPRHAEGVCASRVPQAQRTEAAPKAFASLAALKSPRNTR